MSRDLSSRAHAVLTKALGVDRAQREELVQSECAGDAPLEARVRRLLKAADESDSFLSAPALAHPALAPSADGARSGSSSGLPFAIPTMPDAVGTYLVVGVLGSGGMATVYEAVQENPNRRVALKVMHQTMTHTDALLRFRLEAQTLARLHHPGIAQIYEAGTAQLGQPRPSPFFAMELIPGALSITAYAKRHALPLRTRLEMLASVCDAVHHGHQHGIVHRDLKPGNVLVGVDGRAKVIDFGVARTVEPTNQPLTAVSEVPQLIGTLNYMSPEQCSTPCDIDTRTDVYSLGVLLYELVCGHLPHDLSALPLPAAVAEIVHGPARRPGWPPSRTHRDLEAIMFMAMHKQPDRRYQSAAALAADIGRLLHDQAIEARPPGVIDHFRLFARRNRTLVAAGLVIAAGTVLIAVISTAFALRLSAEVDRRREAEQKASRERDAAQWEAYTAQIAGALSAMRTGEFEQMRTRLADASRKHHGWEWGFLSRLAERSASTINGHDDMIMALAPCGGGTRHVTAARDGSIKLWRLGDAGPLAVRESDSRTQARAVAATWDDQRIIAGDDDGIITLLDAATLEVDEVVTRLPAPALDLVGLPGGRIAAAGSDGRAYLFTLEPRRATVIGADQPGGVSGLAVSPCGDVMATFNDRGGVWLRDTADMAVRQRLEFRGSINQVRFSADGRWAAAAGAGGTVRVWNVADGTLTHELRATNDVNSTRSLAFSNDATMLAVGLTHRGIVVFSLADGRIIGELGGHTDAVTGLFFRPDDGLLVSTSWDRSIRNWRTSEFSSPAGMLTLDGHKGHVRGIAFSPDGAEVASVSEDGDLRLWDPELAGPVAQIQIAKTSLNAVEFSPDGRLIGVACSDGAVVLLDADSGRVTANFKSGARSIASLAFDPSGEHLATGSEDGTVRVWDLRTNAPSLEFKAHKARVNTLRFSPDGATIASGSRDHTVRLSSAGRGDELHRLTDHTSDVFTVLFSRDGNLLYSGSRDQTVRVWSLEAARTIATLSGHGQYVTCLALNPEGNRLAAGSWFGEIVIFDVPTFDQIASFRAHDSAIRGISFSPDGRWLASGSYDATVRLFDSAARDASDDAAERARTRRGNAERLLRPILDISNGDSERTLRIAREAGLSPASDPWIRKAVLSATNPPRPEEPNPPRDLSHPAPNRP